jgi:exosortase
VIATPPRRDAYRRATRAVVSDRLTPNRLMAAIALLGLGLYVCADAWDEIFSYAWGNEEYAHILVVPFVAALLVYVRRLRLRHFRVSGTLVGPLLVIAGLAVMMAGYEARRQAMFHSGAVLTAVGCVVSVLGKGAIFRFLPAVLVLAFLVPVPGGWRLEIALRLQYWTTQIAHVLLAAVGFPNEVAGYTISLNGQPIVIAEACNGMRSVFTLLLLAFAFAFGLPLRNSVRILLLLISPLVALSCNVIRTLPTILMYGYAPGWFDNPNTGTWFAEQFHWVCGWAMYATAIAIWLGIVSILRWALLPIQRFTLASQ